MSTGQQINQEKELKAMKKITIEVNDSFNPEKEEVIIVDKEDIGQECEECGGATILIGQCVACDKSWTMDEHIYRAEVL